MKRSLLKQTILDTLLIVATATGVFFILKHGSVADYRQLSQTSPAKLKTQEISICPRDITGRIDNFRQPISLTPIQTWGAQAKECIALTASSENGTAQPSARLVLIPFTTSPVVLQVQYTVAEDMVKAISADPVTKAKYDGVTILLTTVGVAYNQSTLLTLDPVHVNEERKWLSCNLALPTGTREVHISIIGAPPNYNVFKDSCAIYLPQLRVLPAKAQ